MIECPECQHDNFDEYGRCGRCGAMVWEEIGEPYPDPDLDLKLDMTGLEALRLSATGRDPDQTSSRPAKQRICMKKIINEHGERIGSAPDQIGESVAKDAVDIAMDFAARTSGDRALWRHYLKGAVK